MLRALWGLVTNYPDASMRGEKDSNLQGFGGHVRICTLYMQRQPPLRLNPKVDGQTSRALVPREDVCFEVVRVHPYMSGIQEVLPCRLGATHTADTCKTHANTYREMR